MLRRIDPSTDPCTDFYQFTCGKYLRGTEETLPNLYKTVARQAEDEVTNILNEQEAPNDSDLLKVLKNAHQKCINGGMCNVTFSLKPVTFFTFVLRAGA